MSPKIERDTWHQVMEMEGVDTRHRQPPDQIANDLTQDEVTTIIATAEFFGAELADMQQMYFDLVIARYRVFDWLAMGVMGRIDCKPALKVFVHSFLKSKGDVDTFIADLRSTDYDIDHSWEKVALS